MGNQSPNSHDIYTRHVSSGTGARPGVAKDQLIFIIICAVAVTVAAIALVHSFTSGSKVQPSIWQCIDHGHEFKTAAYTSPPVKCSKCGGKVARLVYRVCPACGKKVLSCRVHANAQSGGAAGPAGGPPGMGMMQPASIQYWVKQEDGSFGWSPWMLAGSPQSQQMERNMICPECGESTSLSTPRGAGR